MQIAKRLAYSAITDTDLQSRNNRPKENRCVPESGIPSFMFASHASRLSPSGHNV
jgi:hypothetical protein